MKNLIIIICFLAGILPLSSQELGWFPDDQNQGHIVTLQIGADFGTVYGLSYGYKFGGSVPFMLGADVTTPFGKTFMDDFKASLVGETMFYPADHIGIGFRPALTCRRYASSAAMLLNIGVEMGTSIGYYRDTWGIAAEAEYDLAHATMIEHRTLKDYYPEIKDDWYGDTGGTFKFGMQAHYWMKSTGVSLKGGYVFGQDFENNPTIPYYTEFAVMRKL